MASNNPDLGQIECNACGDTANIRRQSNGRRLLYLHCKKCGMDKRSGAKIQSVWGEVIGEVNNENSPAKPVKTIEWTPEIENNEVESNEKEQETENSTGGFGRFIIGGLIAIGTIIGIRG